MKLTIITVLLSIIANILTPTVELVLKKNNGIDLIKYWYLFILIIFISFIYDLVRLLLDEEKSSIMRGKVYKVLFKITNEKADEKKYIINDINGRINFARKKLDFTNKLLPKMVKVEWVDSSDQNCQVYDIADNQFVVKICRSKSQDENIIDIAYAVTKRTALAGIRYVIHNNEHLETSIDDIFVEKLIRKAGLKKVIDTYYSRYLLPNLSDLQKKKIYDELHRLDDIGTFLRVFFVEVEEFTKQLTGRSYRPMFLGEIEGLIPFLLNIQPDFTPQGVNLDYFKAFMRVHIVLIRTEKIKQVGIDKYLESIDIAIKKGMFSIYIIYFERENYHKDRLFNERIMALIQEASSRPTLEKVLDEKYEVFLDNCEMRIARCIRFVNSEN